MADEPTHQRERQAEKRAEWREEWPRKNALLVLDAVADAIVTIDSNGLIQYANVATSALFGYSQRELLDAPVEVLMPERHGTEHGAYVRRYLATGEPRIIGKSRELSARHRDGHEFPINVIITELQTEDGIHFAGVIRDLTAQKALQVSRLVQREQLARVGRLSTMGEMTASIAHEMNQPLTAIAMYALACQRLLEQGEVDGIKFSAALAKLADQALRAGAVNERVQRFIRNDDGPLEWKNINRLLRDIEPLAAGDARLHGIRLSFELAAGLPEVRCSALQLQQVALNLIRNALDAMTEADCEGGQTVIVRSERVEDNVRVSIVDSGPGISAEVQANLFSPFHTTKKDGLGLGLSTCRTLIAEHGGSLDFFNHQPNGATFYFDLPGRDNNE